MNTALIQRDVSKIRMIHSSASFATMAASISFPLSLFLSRLSQSLGTFRTFAGTSRLGASHVFSAKLVFFIEVTKTSYSI